MDTSNGVTVSQFLEICKEQARDLGIKYGSEEALKEKIIEYFSLALQPGQYIFTDDCWTDAVNILQN